MHPKKFLKQISQFVETQMVKSINQLLGHNRTAFLSLGLFLKLPVKFTVEQTTLVPFNKKMTLDELDYCFTSTIYAGDITEVQFIFLYHDEKHLKHLYKVIEKYPTYFAYHYLKQLQHTLRNHYTSVHQSFMRRHCNLDDPMPTIKLANDYAINAVLGQIFSKTTAIIEKQSTGKSIKTKSASDIWDEIRHLIHYNKDYENLHETDILKKLTGDTPRQLRVESVSEYVDRVYTGDTTSFLTAAKECKQLKADKDTDQSHLASSLYTTIRSVGKGTGGPGAQIMMQQFESVETDTKWFANLKSSLEKTVYYKTHHFKQTWKQLDNRYRHLFPKPTTEYKITKLDLILSIDESGSMDIQDLQKLLFIFEENKHLIQKCTVIVHTGTVDKVFTLEDDYDITEDPNFEFMKARLANGGTSHDPVFSYIQNEMHIEKPAEVVYISLSDNQSDIEDTIHNYPIMRELSKYWLSPIGSDHVCENTVGGINVTMN